MEIRKIISIIAVALLFANFIFFVLGKIDVLRFWIFLILVSAISFLMQKILRSFNEGNEK